MPKCTPCLGSDIKKAILGSIISDAVRAILDKIPDCPDARGVVVCGGTTRQRSKYQQFVSECMKSKHIKGRAEAPLAMKECAAAWRAKKGEPSARTKRA